MFRFSAPCRYSAAAWKPSGIELGEEFRLPNFSELDDAPKRVDVAAAWSEQGLLFSVDVTGKKQAPWCRESRVEESDGVFLWIDTRDTHNIHRASRFCHQFVFLPTGGGLRQLEPIAEMLLINRARENPKPVRPGTLAVVNKKQPNGYRLDIRIPEAALTGFDPTEHPRLGFHWAVIDRELGRTHVLLPAGVAISRRPERVGNAGVATMRALPDNSYPAGI